MFTHTYNGRELDFAKFHPDSQIAMAKRGITHFLGSEISSKLGTWRDGENEKRKEAGGEPLTDADIASKREELVSQAIDALHAGTVGTRGTGTGTPRLDPHAAEVQRIAKAEATTVLASIGKKMPKGEAKLAFAGKEMSGAEIVALHLNGADKKGMFGPAGQANKERIEKLATKKLADLAKSAAKAKAVASGVDESDLM